MAWLLCAWCLPQGTTDSLSQRLLKSDARSVGANQTPATQHTVYADDGIGSTVLGQYANRRSSTSAAPQNEADSTEIIYLPTASGPLPVAAQINGRLYAIDADHLNTPRRLTNLQGQVAWQWLITGFGETPPTTGAEGYAQPGTTGLQSYAEPVPFELRYPGQQWDAETNLAYNLHRYYDAQSGRYIQADPIGLEGGWNRFGYVGGNPLSFNDPEGLQSRGPVTPGGPGAHLRWPSIGPSQAPPQYQINQNSTNRGRLSQSTANLLDTFSVNANGTITMRQTREGFVMFETVRPDGTRLVYREGREGPRLDIYEPNGGRETIHPPSGGVCLR
ncbi:RHS repeat-associated core domain-containing protein [Paenacidovorax monticola]|uniref:RHS repeat-associated core domain-containing protein n=1 Tax=Paenacidovorax monticola TaxID=1926868 RepID=A0A7H0HHA9_9BURK|nr:RHS repeat-associated core domain-containing protein [Paenacidovorax monticola]QNP59925.1 RHS repeat-associated core domain-containing protein [Paenacidovorax monticola]